MGEASSQEINEEEGGTASPTALTTTTTSAFSPSPANCDMTLEQVQSEPPPPSYEEALSMTAQEEKNHNFK